MKLIVAIAVLLTITGCAAQTVHHTPRTMSGDEARTIIEQVVMEQPPRHRPVAIQFADTYLVMHFGRVTQTSTTVVPIGNSVVANGSAVTSDSATRIYFDSIDKVRLYHKRDWYILDIVDSTGRVMSRSYSLNERKARRFVDAIERLRGTI